MGKNKLRRFAENKTFKNLFQPQRKEVLSSIAFRGRWRKEVFKNDNPIVLELGCGKGEYTTGMAQIFPEKNFIGIDIKGARLWFGATEALNKNLDNVFFIRTQIELIANFFAEGEVDEIWITFPDPQIKFKRGKHRMTNALFLSYYSKILKKGGYVHLKTDSEFLHGYTLGVLENTDCYQTEAAHHDIYGAPEFETARTCLRSIRTFYENQFLSENKKITYLRAKFL